jgi:hypothetical protein
VISRKNRGPAQAPSARAARHEVARVVDDARALVAEREGQAVDVLLAGQLHDEPVGGAQRRRRHLEP